MSRAPLFRLLQRSYALARESSRTRVPVREIVEAFVPVSGRIVRDLATIEGDISCREPGGADGCETGEGVARAILADLGVRVEQAA